MWLRQISNEIPEFINQLNDDGNLKFCKKGSLKGAELFSYVFLVKILFMLKKLDNKNKIFLAENILRHKKKNGMIFQNLSFFNDNKIFYLRNMFNLRHNLKIIKLAETRQSISALIQCDYKHDYGFFFPYESIKINKFLFELDKKDPWGYFSHVSHLVFFIKNSNIISSKEKKNLIVKIFENLRKKFYNLDINYLKKFYSNQEIINLLMKLSMALETCELNLNLNNNAIIDLALEKFKYRHACDFLNNIKVINFFSDGKYKKEIIEKKFYEFITILQNHFNHEHKAFSFFVNKSQTVIYNKKVSVGYNEPDLHGTVLYLWSLSLIEDTLNKKSDKILKKPLM